MVSLQETSTALYGAWRLARLDPQGLSYFDTSERGFWRSFWAAVLVAPAYALIVALDRADDPMPVDALRQFLVEGISYVLSWTAFPLAMASLAEKLGRMSHYIRYIVAHNWAAVLEMTALLPAVILSTNTPGLTELPILVACAMFAYQWYVARTALALDPLQAILPVALNFGIGLVLGFAARALLAASPAPAPMIDPDAAVQTPADHAQVIGAPADADAFTVHLLPESFAEFRDRVAALRQQDPF